MGAKLKRLFSSTKRLLKEKPIELGSRIGVVCACVLMAINGICPIFNFLGRCHQPAKSPNMDSNGFVMVVTTNLVSRPCPCGFCRPEEGIAVPEHINSIGFDLVVEVRTNYYPLVQRPLR